MRKYMIFGSFLAILMLLSPTVLAGVDCDFYWVPGNPEPGETVTFYDHSSFTDGEKFLESTWVWNGDYDHQEVEHDGYIEHTWENPGTFSILHTILGTNGNGDGCDDTITISENHGPDLSVSGKINGHVEPGGDVYGSFTVENCGDPGSELDWSIVNLNEWSDIGPIGGYDLTPEDGSVTVNLHCVAPTDECINKLKIIVQNDHDSDDTEIVPVIMNTPKVKSVSYLPMFRLFESHPRLLPLLRNVFNL